MASRYSIIQYIPNPIADERINIGAIAFDEDVVRVQFLQRWERVRDFGMENIDFLKDFAARMKEATAAGLLFPGDEPDMLPRQERLRKIARNWFNSIQFTEPRGSLEDVESLLQDIAETYLRETQTAQPQFRSRQDAVKVATKRIKKILERIANKEAEELLKKDYSLHGSHADHKFDVVVANGKPYLAAQAISFEVKVPEPIQNSISWMIADIKQNKPDFPLAIFALPPKQESRHYKDLERIYQKTTSMYSNLGADVVGEKEIDSWVSRSLEKIV
ncbi:MAG: DUF3037 domain-containing protein [Hydrococcus sp. Prado102]|nr:DUF3037 domain-containing protein [Hydrococcus sp. Prado102]